MNRGVRRAAAVALCAGLTSCAQARNNLVTGDYHERVQSVKRVGVVLAETDVLDIGALGGTALNERKSSRSRACFEAAVVESLAARGFEARLLPDEEGVRLLAADFLQLRGPIMAKRHFPGNAGRLEGLRPLEGAGALAAAHGVDAFLLVSAIDHQASAASTLTATFAGFLGGSTRGYAYAYAALVDRTGVIVSYSGTSDATGGSRNLTRERDVAAVCAELTAELAAAGR